MIQIEQVLEILDHHQRAVGLPNLARQVGATHICAFICDPELGHYLPGPGFPQTLPEGLAWRRFLIDVQRNGHGRSLLNSPFLSKPVQVEAATIARSAIVALYGSGTRPEALEELSPAMQILAALLEQEIKTRVAENAVFMARASVSEADQLSQALSAAHDKIASILCSSERLTEQLRTEREKLHLAHQIAGIGVWEFDPASKSLRCSEEAVRIFGFAPGASELPLEDLLQRIHDEDRNIVARQLLNIDPGDGECNFQLRIIHDDGAIRWIENRGSVLVDSGNRQLLICLSIDISQRVLTEQTLARSERLATAGRLSASIAHEINNPLEALVNIIYLAETQENPEEIRRLLAMAHEELKRVSTVAKQSLRFYRDLNTPVRFCLGRLVEDSLDLLRAQIASLRIHIVRDIHSEETDVNGWPAEIMHAIANLVTNAAQASKQNTTLRVRLYRRHSEVRLLIVDQGSGIPKEIAKRIFEPFFSTKREGGTGLGLWITQQIIGKHHGTLRMRSSTAPQKSGTVFRIALPHADFASPVAITDGYRWLGMRRTSVESSQCSASC